jgi:hypothetical protein
LELDRADHLHRVERELFKEFAIALHFGARTGSCAARPGTNGEARAP